MVLKTISPGCGVQASLMLFLSTVSMQLVGQALYKNVTVFGYSG